MIKKIVLGSLIALSLCSACFAEAKQAAKPSSVLVNGLQYEAGLASSAIAHKDLCSIAFGTADDTVGGEKEDVKRRSGGVPTSYVPLADGSFWVLDAINQKMKRFAPDGKLVTSIIFPGSGASRYLHMKDLAVIPTGGFYLYNSTQGIIVRVDEKGRSRTQIEGLPDSREIGVDSKGNLLVANPLKRSLFRFSPAGELIEKYEGQNFLSTIVDASDRPLGMKFNAQEAELFRAEKASPTVNVSIAKFPLQMPKERNAHYVSAKVLGTDAKKNVYLELIACDKSGVIHQHRVLRITAEGKTLAQADLLAIPYIYPRKKAITPDGRIFSFRRDRKSWIPIVYTLP